VPPLDVLVSNNGSQTQRRGAPLQQLEISLEANGSQRIEFKTKLREASAKDWQASRFGDV